VVLHLIRPRELLGTNWTGEHLSLVSFVVEESMALETVLVLKSLVHVYLGALHALVDTLGDGRVAEQVQSADAHLRQLLGGILAGGRGPPPARALRGLPPGALRVGRRRVPGAQVRGVRVAGRPRTAVLIFVQIVIIVVDGGAHRMVQRTSTQSLQFGDQVGNSAH